MFAQLVSTVDSFLWGWPLIILLFGTHIFMTIRTGFIQKDIFKAIKMSVTADEDSEGDVSQFGAGRSRICFLDVDDRYFRHCHQVCRDPDRRQI